MNNTLTQNIYKSFFKYVSLNILSMLGLSLYILADTFFIANGAGSNGLTALNIALPVFSAMNGFGFMLGVGSSTLFSIFKGEGNDKKANKVFTHGLFLSLGTGLFFSVTALFFSSPICALFGADADILPIADSYIKTLLLFSPAFITNNLLNSFVRNDNAPNLSMAAMLTSTISNIFLDYILVIPLNMGMFGAAVATAMSPLIGITILSSHFIRRKNSFKPVKCRPELQLAARIISLGFPSYITEIANGVVIFIFNLIILNICGNTGVAAYRVISNISLVAISIFNGISLGIQPIISYNYGAQNSKNIKKTFAMALVTALILGSAICAAGVFFARPVTALFNSENDPALAEIAVNGIHIYFTAFIITGINIVCISYFSSTARAVKSFLLSVLRGVIGILPFVFILPGIFGLNGVWASVPLCELTTLIISAIFILFDKSLKKSYNSHINKRE